MSEVLNRDPDPRGPDAPDKHQQYLPRKQGRDAHEYHLVAAPRVQPSRSAIAPPPVRWVGTNFNFDPGHAVDGIVLHTEVGTNASATGRFQQPNQASAHYGVAYDGSEVVQWVSEQNTAWHCGRYYPDGSHMGNTNSIGIEHEDNGQYNSPRPDGLYETSARLVAWICQRYGLPINFSTVRGECGHRDVSIVGTACPDSLDVGRIIARANELVSPPAPPAWKAALKADPYSVTLEGAVPLYDLTTGAKIATVGPGPVSFAYSGTIGGADYRVTAFSFMHDTPHGVLASDVVSVPEWRKNLVPFVATYRLRWAVPLWNLETMMKTDRVVAAGPVAVQHGTKVQGKSYAMTDYSVSRNIPNGLLEDDLLAADTPPPKPPVPDPGPIPGSPPGFFEALLEFLRKFFGGK